MRDERRAPGRYFTMTSVLQTLTTLDLGDNRIGALGAEHLAAALRVNRVRGGGYVYSSYSTVRIIADTHNTQSFVERYRCCRR